jgi:hypothetical protein
MFADLSLMLISAFNKLTLVRYECEDFSVPGWHGIKTGNATC